MSKVITVMSTKGGVGKSTLTRFLAITLQEHGYTTCLIDLCQNGSIASGFLKNRDSFEYTAFDWLSGKVPPSQVIQQFNDTGIYYVPSNETIDDFESWAEKNFTMATRINAISNKVKPFKEMFDFILIDTHPSENSDLVSYAIAASDLCLIPLEVDLDSKIAAQRSAEIVMEFKTSYDLDYAIVPNKVSPTNGKIRKQLDAMKEELASKGIPEEKFLSNIRYSDLVSTSKNEGIMLNELNNKYATNTMNDFRQVTKEILEILMVSMGEVTVHE